jgi:hypothetical protein
MDERCLARNDASCAQLHALIKKLTDQQLDAALADGWTVKALLAHLAWWDRYMVALMRDWMAGGCASDISTPPMRGGRFVTDYDNAAGMADWLALPAAWLRREVLRAAEEADASAADVCARLRDDGRIEDLPRVADRSVHRLEHLEQISAALP